MTGNPPMLLPFLPALPPESMNIGADPRLIRAEIEALIEETASNAPRSLQKRIGPSELGTPCARKLVFKLAGVEPVNLRDPWRPTVGTAVHAWLADALMDYNARNGFTRYLVENRVMVGTVNGVEITGSADAYDRVTAEVIDWKIVGTTTLKDAKRNGMKQGYRVQAHLYGSGFVRRGVPVHGVNIAYLPSSGELKDSVWCREPYQESIATEAIVRAGVLSTGIAVIGAEAMIPATAATDDHCSYCPFWNPAVTVPSASGCPGAGPAKQSLAAQLVGV